jgi:hypothetical protein
VDWHRPGPPATLCPASCRWMMPVWARVFVRIVWATLAVAVFVVSAIGALVMPLSLMITWIFFGSAIGSTVAKGLLPKNILARPSIQQLVVRGEPSIWAGTVAARDRRHLRHRRQVMMKGSVEARHLGGDRETCGGMPQSAGFPASGVGAAVVRAGVDHPMPHRGQWLATGARLDPSRQRLHRRGMIRCRERPRDVLGRVHPGHRERGVGPADPVDLEGP